MRLKLLAIGLAVFILGGVGGAFALGVVGGPSPLGFAGQACSLPEEELVRILNGQFLGRSGDISLLPREPSYMARGEGWSHSGPWDYLQHIPLVFYGPGWLETSGEYDRPVTLADVAPTLATMLKGSMQSDGESLDEVVKLEEMVGSTSPRLILTIVWDGGGWNVLDRFPDAWPNLRLAMSDGVNFTNAAAGSSPSVTPAVHTTLGTGFFPATHSITGVKVHDDSGVIGDSFAKGESSRLIRSVALAERWDEQNNNEALIGMIGYEPWHLGMIGQGAERPTGDRDHAAWLDIDTNEWITNQFYEMPAALPRTPGLEDDLQALDAADGKVDGAWGEHEILDQPDRIDATPAFVAYQARGLLDVIESEGYGRDAVTDLMFTNFKPIDRVGHYYNMASDEVRETLVETDKQLGVLFESLDALVGAGRWVTVITADHGQQPDAAELGAYPINPDEIEADLLAEFGPVVESVLPTEVFVHPDALSEGDADLEAIARFLGGYRLRDNAKNLQERLFGVRDVDPQDLLFELAIPAEELSRITCATN